MPYRIKNEYLKSAALVTTIGDESVNLKGCGLVAIHYHNNGATTIQGVQKSTDTGNFSETKKKMQVICHIE